jgi:hypothetical protein
MLFVILVAIGSLNSLGQNGRRMRLSRLGDEQQSTQRQLLRVRLQVDPLRGHVEVHLGITSQSTSPQLNLDSLFHFWTLATKVSQHRFRSNF